MVKVNQNDLHSDGSSEYLDEYDSDPLEGEINSVRLRKTTKLYVNPNNVFQSSVLKPQTISSQQNLFHKQSQTFERRRPEMIDPGDDCDILTNNGMDQGRGRRTGNVFQLDESSSSAEPKQSVLPVVDPAPKRIGPHHLQPLESPKKMRMDPRLNQSKGAQGSVLLNLLVRGEDASHGYLCPANQSDHLKYKLLPEATVLEKPLNTQPKMSHALRADVRSTRRAHNLVL